VAARLSAVVGARHRHYIRRAMGLPLRHVPVSEDPSRRFRSLVAGRSVWCRRFTLSSVEIGGGSRRLRPTARLIAL
jgi:hypothetical protein